MLPIVLQLSKITDYALGDSLKTKTKITEVTVSELPVSSIACVQIRRRGTLPAAAREAYLRQKLGYDTLRNWVVAEEQAGGP